MGRIVNEITANPFSWGEERGIPTIKKRNAWRKKGVAARGKDTTEKKHPKRDFRATKMECLRKNSDIKKKMSLKKKKKERYFKRKKIILKAAIRTTRVMREERKVCKSFFRI